MEAIFVHCRFYINLLNILIMKVDLTRLQSFKLFYYILYTCTIAFIFINTLLPKSNCQCILFDNNEQKFWINPDVNIDTKCPFGKS